MSELIYFHGTGEEYHNQMLKKHGVYRHDSSRRIILTEDAKLAQHYADVRSEDWGDWPAILVVYASRVPDIHIAHGDTFPSCPELMSEWYDFIPATKNLKNKLGEESNPLA